MAKYRWNPAQRYAVFTVHGEKCYLCNTPVNLKTMEIDHVIPEALLDDPEKLAAAIKALGRPENFNVNSFANWLPACRPCNGKKLDLVFEPSLLIQMALQRAAEKANDVAALAQETVSEKKVANALNLLEQVGEGEAFPDWVMDTLKPLIARHEHHRQRELAGTPLRLTPLYEVLSERNGIRVIRGPYGIGAGPTGPHVHSSFHCPTCGGAGWNGARCVICGEMSDD